jgi:hypothetical protein
MERRYPLQTHVWADDNIQQIMQDGEIIFYHRCVRCGRDFMRPHSRTGWHAAYVGILRIEPLADSVTKQWVTEDCPGRLLTDDCRSRTTRQSGSLRARGGMRDLAGKRV